MADRRAGPPDLHCVLRVPHRLRAAVRWTDHRQADDEDPRRAGRRLLDDLHVEFRAEHRPAGGHAAGNHLPGGDVERVRLAHGQAAGGPRRGDARGAGGAGPHLIDGRDRGPARGRNRRAPSHAAQRTGVSAARAVHAAAQRPRRVATHDDRRPAGRAIRGGVAGGLGQGTDGAGREALRAGARGALARKRRPRRHRRGARAARDRGVGIAALGQLFRTPCTGATRRAQDAGRGGNARVRPAVPRAHRRPRAAAHRHARPGSRRVVRAQPARGGGAQPALPARGGTAAARAPVHRDRRAEGDPRVGAADPARDGTPARPPCDRECRGDSRPGAGRGTVATVDARARRGRTAACTRRERLHSRPRAVPAGDGVVDHHQ